jgi:hypothetical protein
MRIVDKRISHAREGVYIIRIESISKLTSTVMKNYCAWEDVKYRQRRDKAPIQYVYGM